MNRNGYGRVAQEKGLEAAEGVVEGSVPVLEGAGVEGGGGLDGLGGALGEDGVEEHAAAGERGDVEPGHEGAGTEGDGTAAEEEVFSGALPVAGVGIAQPRDDAEDHGEVLAAVA